MWETIVQGIVQGLTEFLPISSTGHLVLSQRLFGFADLDPAFNVFVQGGTVFSLFLFYLPKLRTLKLTPRYLQLLVLATIPAVVAGLWLENSIETMFSSLYGIAFGFLLTTICLILPKLFRPSVRELNLSNAFLIGLAQAAAILPSLSRSGATLGIALALGIAPQAAFDFSFLMSIPVVAGASLLSLRHLDLSGAHLVDYSLGFVIAAIVGYFSLIVLARLTKQGKLHYFAPYTFLLVIVSLLLVVFP